MTFQYDVNALTLRYFRRTADAVLNGDFPHVDLRDYPAELHINLAEAARGLGLGRKLMQACLDQMTELGIPGIHLKTTTMNAAAIKLYEKMGFKLLARKRTHLWDEWLPGEEIENLVYGKRLGETRAWSVVRRAISVACGVSTLGHGLRLRHYHGGPMSHEAILWERLGPDELRVRCNLCAHRCVILPGRLGACCVRENVAGTLVTLVYDRTISQNVDPIEKKPLFHFQPGSRAFSIATAGCNFRCTFCQNWEISQLPREGSVIPGSLATPATDCPGRASGPAAPPSPTPTPSRRSSPNTRSTPRWKRSRWA